MGLILGEVLNPDWGNIRKCHDWKNHISDEIADMWETFTVEQKVAIAEQAESRASNEEWE